MAEYKLLLPSMGEGVMEATIISWMFNEGDFIKEDESVVEIATDKVDSDVPTPVSGKIIKILKQKDEVAKIGEAIAILETEAISQDSETPEPKSYEEVKDQIHQPEPEIVSALEQPLSNYSENSFNTQNSDMYLSPLVKSIVQEEKISESELKTIKGSGQEGRITKEDILSFVKNRGVVSESSNVREFETPKKEENISSNNQTPKPSNPQTLQLNNGDEIIQMDRVRKIIAEAMVNSKHTSPHVTSFIETDVTNVVTWRNANKNSYQKRDGEKLTFMPIFIRAVVKAIQDFPMINVSVDGDKIIKKKNINIGMATALPDGNLIVPVIKNADQLSLSGLAKAINDLTYRARNKKLRPEDTQGATYTISNVGSFGNLMGTPIIPQPQVAILAIGAIVKKPAVIETEFGDVIAIRQKMFRC